MKNIRIIFNVIATLLCMALAFLLIYPFLGNPKEKELRKMVNVYYETHDFTNFEEYQSIRLCDEVEQQIKVMNTKLNWDKSFCEAYRENLDGEVESTLSEDEVVFSYNYYKHEIEKDEKMLEYLKYVNLLYPEKYNEVSYTTYRITYLGKDKDGNVIHDRCYGKFDNDGVMVAYRMSDTAEWKVTYKGETTSIPKYREMLLQ